MKLKFIGASRGVTGSKHLLEVNGKKILLDCGLFQGHRKEAGLWNESFPFDPKEIDILVLSHAHIDHSGAIPLLVKRGFEGPIYCTHATRDLCSIMLMDSAYIQEKDAEYMKRKDPDAEPLYTIEDAQKSMTNFRSVAYGRAIPLTPHVKVTFHDAGHILGSAVEEWDIYDEATDQHVRFGFTGDLGRKNLPILRDPEKIRDLDILMTESTYGNRLHEEIQDVETHLAQTVNKTVERGGKVIIPSFSVGRTQEVLYVLHDLMQSGTVPTIPIYVDSPLSKAATEIFRVHPECFDDEMMELLQKGSNPFFDHGHIHFTRDVEESKSLKDIEKPVIIISASGMCESGRIRHHLINHIGDERNTMMVVGFMARNTLGRKLVDHENPVNIFGDPYAVKAEVVIYNAFSAHADQKGLLRFAEHAGTLKNVFCVHGEDDQMIPFRAKLKNLPNMTDAQVHIPTPGDIFELVEGKRMVKSEEIDYAWRDMFTDESVELGEFEV